MATISEIKRLLDEGEYLKAGEAAMKAAGEAIGDSPDVRTGGAKPKVGEQVIEVVTSGDVDLPVALKTAAEVLRGLELPFRDAQDARGNLRARRDLDEIDREMIDLMADESPTASGDDGLKQRQLDEPAIATLSQESIDDLILAALVEDGMEKGAKLHTKMIADFPELRADGRFADMHRELMGDLWSNKERPLLAEDITKKETLQFLKDNPKITKAYNAAGLFKDTSKKRERSPFEGVTRPLPSEVDDFEPGWALKGDEPISSGYRSKVAQ